MLRKIFTLAIAVISFLVVFVYPDETNKKIIGISNHWEGNDVNKNLNKYIKDTLTNAGYKVVSLSANGVFEQQKQHVKLLIDKNVDGIIIKGGIGDDFLDLAKEAANKNIPLVAVEMELPSAVASIGSPDNTYRILTKWLIKKMGTSGKYMIVTNRGWHPLDERQKNTLAEMSGRKEYSLANDTIYTVGLKDPINENYEVIKKVLKKDSDIKGVIVTWGIPVISAATAIQELDRTREVSIIGCDADRAVVALMSKSESPNISVMAWDHKEMARMGVIALLEAMKYSTVKEAKKNIQFKQSATPIIVTNVKEDLPFFGPVKTYLPNEFKEININK